jgi:hypothetical protein
MHLVVFEIDIGLASFSGILRRQAGFLKILYREPGIITFVLSLATLGIGKCCHLVRNL